MRMLLLLFIGLMVIPQSHAQENPPSAPEPAATKAAFKGFKHTGTGRVDQIIDASTILMKDGKIVRLLGIEYPQKGEGLMVAGKAYLQKTLPESAEVMLFQNPSKTYGRVNRMGHDLAHIAIKSSGAWVNGGIIENGFAYAYTDKSNPRLSDALYAVEAKAREAGKGIWTKDSGFGVLTPENAGDGEGQFRVVEGIVMTAASSKNNLYLNFGNDRMKDFTVMIPSSLRKTFAKRGVDLMGLSGKTIRVRGWVRIWNGPFMEIETAERVEVK